MIQDNLREEYIKSASIFKQLSDKESTLITIISLLRLFIFAGGIIITWVLFITSIPAGIISGIFFIAVFLYLLKLFSLHSDRHEFLSGLVRINQNEAEAISGNLSSFDPGNSYIDIQHDFSYDIDLFGSASIFQYLNRTVTEYGRDILAGWLSDPYLISNDMANRQEMVRELALKLKWRQEFLASGMKTPLKKSEITSLLSWLEDNTSDSKNPVYKVILYLLPSLAVLSFILMITGVLTYLVFSSVFLINLLIITLGLKRINSIHSSLSRKYNFLISLNALLHSFGNESFTSPVLSDIRANISGNTVSAAVAVKKLGKLIRIFDNRNNILVSFILNGLLLWDYQSVTRLEKWKSEYRSKFGVWLDMMGMIDACVSLGNYAFNNPEFTYPHISADSEFFSAKNMGHQLINERRRVCNDFSLGKKGTICIISGANMAGKSTFLRTIAVNYILGMVGAPVCASEMSLIPARLFTSMRTTDSLSGNESYFYAELRRLNTLKLKISENEPVLFVLDEILKGTNSEDKSNGSKLFIQRLIERSGTGLIATHDTSLGKLEEDYPESIINKCFEIEIDGQNIIFDYKIQDGITQQMNAVFLMKQMGILD